MVSSKFNRKFFAAFFAAYVFLFSPTTYAADDTPAYVLRGTDDDDMPAYIRGDSDKDKPPVYVDNPPVEKPFEKPVEKPPEVVQPPDDDGQGLEFLMYNQNGVMAFALIAAHEYYKVRPVIAGNRIQGRATLSQISKNYNEIAMINANYFFPDGAIIGQ